MDKVILDAQLSYSDFVIACDCTRNHHCRLLHHSIWQRSWVISWTQGQLLGMLFCGPLKLNSVSERKTFVIIYLLALRHLILSFISLHFYHSYILQSLLYPYIQQNVCHRLFQWSLSIQLSGKLSGSFSTTNFCNRLQSLYSLWDKFPWLTMTNTKKVACKGQYSPDCWVWIVSRLLWLWLVPTCNPRTLNLSPRHSDILVQRVRASIMSSLLWDYTAAYQVSNLLFASGVADWMFWERGGECAADYRVLLNLERDSGLTCRSRVHFTTLTLSVPSSLFTKL